MGGLQRVSIFFFILFYKKFKTNFNLIRSTLEPIEDMGNSHQLVFDFWNGDYKPIDRFNKWMLIANGKVKELVDAGDLDEDDGEQFIKR